MGDRFDIKFSDKENILGLLELGDDSAVNYSTFRLKDVLRLLTLVEPFDSEVDIGIATQHTQLLIARPHGKDGKFWFGLAEIKD